eukprot:6178603-Pleurochrysis_carterae.AAC.2
MKSAPIARMEVELKPAHASAGVMISTRSKKVVVPRRTRSGAQSFAMRRSAESRTHNVRYALPARQTSKSAVSVKHAWGANTAARHALEPKMKMLTENRRRHRTPSPA